MKKLPAHAPGWAYPLSHLYGAGVNLRNKLFDWGILKSRSFDIPIICVGNITVGGTGKTPHTEYLIELLQDKYQVAVLSRGYKRSTSGYLLANEQSTAEEIGDEPYQILRKYPKTIVAVAEDRCLGIENLLALKEPSVDVILLDDGFQHRRVSAGLNILLTDYHNPFYDDRLMPAGTLRESAKGTERAQIIIATKCPEDMTPISYKIVLKGVSPSPFQELFFTSFAYGKLQPLFDEEADTRTLDSIKRDESILLVTGIAAPDVLAAELKKHTRRLHLMEYDDHHKFTGENLAAIVNRFDNLETKKRIIITTEKDAAKLVHCPQMPDTIKRNLYVLPVKVNVLQGQKEALNKKITDYVKENKRNSSFS